MTRRARTPSRGRPSKKDRSKSLSRKKQSPQKELLSSAKKSPSKKTTPKSRSNSRSRNANTAPAAVNHHEQKINHSVSPLLHSRNNQTNTKGIFISTSNLSTTHAFASSPYVLRSRTLGAVLAQQTASLEASVASEKTSKFGVNSVSQQLIKFGNTLKQSTQVFFGSVLNVLSTNWKRLFFIIAILLLIGFIFKFQRELLNNVQKINRQVLVFVQQQYDQQREIWQIVSDPSS